MFPETVAVDSRNAFEIGFPLYVEYVKTRFTERTGDIIDTPIKQNFLKLPKHLASVTLETPQIKVKASTLIKLRDACTACPIQAKELFQNEFTCVHEAFFKDGKPYHSVKSKFLQFIEFPSCTCGRDNMQCLSTCTCKRKCTL